MFIFPFKLKTKLLKYYKSLSVNKNMKNNEKNLNILQIESVEMSF